MSPAGIGIGKWLPDLGLFVGSLIMSPAKRANIQVGAWLTATSAPARFPCLPSRRCLHGSGRRPARLGRERVSQLIIFADKGSRHFSIQIRATCSNFRNRSRRRRRGDRWSPQVIKVVDILIWRRLSYQSPL